MFKIKIKYTDGDTEITEIEDYNRAKSFAQNELEWENTKIATITNQHDHVMFEEKGAYAFSH